MMLLEPYFMYNEKWYYYDYKELKYKLTKYATKKAIASYNQFYKELQQND